MNGIRIMPCVCALVSLAPAAIAAEQSPAVTEAIAKIVERRDQTAEYVLDVKRKFKPEDAEYAKAHDLYVTAYSKENAWITTLKMAVQRGKTKNLEKDEAYKKIAADADQAANAFVSYVQGLPGAKTRGIALAAGAALGLNIWKHFSEKRQQARDEEAERLARETKWRSWDEIRPEA